MAPMKISKERGILRLLSNSQGLAQFSFQENRKDRVFGLHNKRPGLENNQRKSLSEQLEFEIQTIRTKLDWLHHYPGRKTFTLFSPQNDLDY